MSIINLLHRKLAIIHAKPFNFPSKLKGRKEDILLTLLVSSSPSVPVQKQGNILLRPVTNQAACPGRHQASVLAPPWHKGFPR